MPVCGMNKNPENIEFSGFFHVLGRFIGPQKRDKIVSIRARSQRVAYKLAPTVAYKILTLIL